MPMPTPLSTPQVATRKAVQTLTGSRTRGPKEKAFEYLVLGATLVALLVLVVLLVDTTLDGIRRLDATIFTNFRSRRPADAGFRAGVTGTLTLMAYVALFTFPLGVGAAVYLEEFAPKNRFTRLMETNIANLAGVPSVVYGLLGLAIFVYALGGGARTVVAGAGTLSLLVLPIVIVAGREAIRAVPQGIRDGGLALGATPLQVVARQVLPAAMPGVLTGTILALSRALGETAPLLVVGALYGRRATSSVLRPLENFTAMPVEILNYIREPRPEFLTLGSAGIVVLLVLLLTMNSVAILLRNRYSRSW
jgi:phosphate transport system permease protein